VIEGAPASWPAPLRERFAHFASRYVKDRSAGLTDRAVGVPPDRRYWTDGMAGLAEDYVADLLGVARNELEVPDDGSDLRLGELTINVKWTPRPDGHLIYPEARRDRLCADLFVLVTGGEPEWFVARGWVSRDRFRRAPVDDVGYGPTLMVPTAWLMPMLNLLPPETWWPR
jgi:hypothetical protein